MDHNDDIGSLVVPEEMDQIGETIPIHLISKGGESINSVTVGRGSDDLSAKDLLPKKRLVEGESGHHYQSLSKSNSKNKRASKIPLDALYVLPDDSSSVTEIINSQPASITHNNSTKGPLKSFLEKT